ncbi:universal stress protein [Aquincola sp. MAHUQ-54]|uniref:Universal stress protein n=1 Tax=Aquincola agrisoli TaxID=3119538 RepID=A0AAW9QM25_9BURK
MATKAGVTFTFGAMHIAPGHTLVRRLLDTTVLEETQMASFTSILAATDFSADGNNAVRRAACLAHELGARLRILHVLKATRRKALRDWFSPTPAFDLEATQARDALRRLAIEMAGEHDLIATVEVAVGDPFETLQKASEHVDLVVLGWRRHGRFKGMLGASTVDRMIRVGRRPVLVVKTSVQGSYRRVLVPIDFTASSDAAIRVADRMRRETGMHVFHAIDSKREAVLREADVPEHVIRETRLMEEGAINARMRRQVARLGLDSAPMNYALAHGHPVRSTLRHAHRLGADLIVAGKQVRSSLGSSLLGSVSSRVVSEAGCDTLIVPWRRESAAPQASRAHAGAWTQGHWIHKKARFASRRAS